jgi:acetolactate synthase small subunit
MIQVETDSQKLVQTIKVHDLSVHGHIFREIKFLARLNFSNKYCPKDCNKVTDALATYGAKN